MSVAKQFKALVDRKGTTYEQVRDFLNDLDARDRRDAIRAISGARRQGKLFELAAAGPKFTIDEMVSSEFGPLAEVVFYGKNSLPTNSTFEKRLCIPAASDHLDGHLIGYNHFYLHALVGPGYFLVRSSTTDPNTLGPVVFDYTQVPSQKPIHWPDIKDNEGHVSGLVYGYMLDYMRALSDDVFIGRAVKHGKVTKNYFILSRA